VYSETVAMSASHKAVVHVYVLLIVVGVSTLLMAEHPERRSERSVAGQYTSSEMDTDLAGELQWLREKTAQVFCQKHSNTFS